MHANLETVKNTVILEPQRGSPIEVNNTLTETIAGDVSGKRTKQRPVEAGIPK